MWSHSRLHGKNKQADHKEQIDFNLIESYYIITGHVLNSQFVINQ